MPSLEFKTEFPYSEDFKGITVPVTLTASRDVRLIATVDSGAKHCLFRAEYAEQLGLELHEGTTLTMSAADGGEITAYGHSVRVAVLDHSVESVVYFTDHPRFRRNVLGRDGWLDRFRFGLVHYDRKLYLSDYDS
jgi:hypothetical protein